MSLAETLLREGDLGGARANLIELVRKSPGSVETRMFLFQLLCLTGEWQKARAQLSAMAQLSPEAQMLSVAYGQAIDAEINRADVFAGKAPAALLVKSVGWAEDLAAALSHAAAGRTDEAAAARERAFDAAPDTQGTFTDASGDSAPFDWIADGDARFGPSLEAIIAGKWGLIPFASLEYVRTSGPKDLRDTVWLPVQVGFRTGQSVAGFLPTRYPGTETSSEASDILARATRWVDGPDGETGIGQHVLSLSNGDGYGLLSLRQLKFG